MSNLSIKRKNILSIFFLLLTISTYAQGLVSITIDDVPNTRIFQENQYNSTLLNKLDTLGIPIAIFINEGRLQATEASSQNEKLLDEWVSREYMTIGNHTYSHSRYSSVGLKRFIQDIERGEQKTSELTRVHRKPYHFFRFPYNDLGKDSLEHEQIQSYLAKNGYTLTPFTIESSDWMFNAVYRYYLQKQDYKAAESIGALYIEKTIAYFAYYDSLTTAIYGRTMPHIYLCHDNMLNEKYLIPIIQKLSKMNYTFISLDAAMEDKLYKQTNNYYGKWGISWIYRWMQSQEERLEAMKQEPNMSKIIELYNELEK